MGRAQKWTKMWQNGQRYVGARYSPNRFFNRFCPKGNWSAKDFLFWPQSWVWIHISGVTKCVAKFLTLSKALIVTVSKPLWHTFLTVETRNMDPITGASNLEGAKSTLYKIKMPQIKKLLQLEWQIHEDFFILFGPEGPTLDDLADPATALA